MAFNYLLGHGFDKWKGKISIMSYDKNITGLAVGILAMGHTRQDALYQYSR